ncbi:MAG: hypothetical protein GWN32_18255 [Gemmatimonadetes bacterium]|nr:hypothetical protein [Gemmatimonadota bacterium]
MMRPADPRASLYLEFAEARAQLRGMERRLIRWMFFLWIMQIAAQFGILYAFFRL